MTTPVQQVSGLVVGPTKQPRRRAEALYECSLFEISKFMSSSGQQ
jgi:hypothetical protein